jgi:NAD(P)-dependent dehydrogenase (short-subunit alcohol dehydrogenase family)
MKNILIIGASTGIGRSLAVMQSKDNKVYGTYDQNSISDNQIQYFHYHHETAPDLSLIPEVIDALVYCPGAIQLKPFARIDRKTFLEDYSLQVGGAIDWIQACLPRLKMAENPSIILFSTVAVQSGFNFHSLVSSSKGAIEGLTKALAAELAPKIRVNCIAPSLTQTPLAANLLNTEEKIQANAQRHPMKRIGQAEDIASLASFLISDQATWITGQIMHVDGGMSTVKM